MDRPDGPRIVPKLKCSEILDLASLVLFCILQVLIISKYNCFRDSSKDYKNDTMISDAILFY